RRLHRTSRRVEPGNPGDAAGRGELHGNAADARPRMQDGAAHEPVAARPDPRAIAAEPDASTDALPGGLDDLVQVLRTEDEPSARGAAHRAELVRDRDRPAGRTDDGLAVLEAIRAVGGEEQGAGVGRLASPGALRGPTRAGRGGDDARRRAEDPARPGG